MTLHFSRCIMFKISNSIAARASRPLLRPRVASQKFSASTRRATQSPLDRPPSPIFKEKEHELKETNLLHLSSGRTLSFAQYGHSQGTPLFFLHGLPSCRLEGRPLQQVFKDAKIRVICPDRPGFGRSTHVPGRAFKDHAEDVRTIAQHLGLTQYRVLGGSGGGPFALACARFLPRDELLATGVFAGSGPYDCDAEGLSSLIRAMRALAYYTPWLLRFLLSTLLVRPVRAIKDEASLLRLVNFVRRFFPKVAVIFDDPETRQLLVDVGQESFRQGVEGYDTECRMSVRQWDFKLEEIPETQKVLLWYGELDANTPAAIGRYYADKVKGSRLTVWDGLTHYNVGNNTMEVVKELIEA